jgi:dTDP-glucose 4,6-dehydratase
MYNEPMEKILVTGGAGFIGSHFVDQCLNKGIEVINYDAMKIGSLPEHGPDKIHPLYGFEKIDIVKDLYQLPNNIDTIVHFAAETHVDRSLSDPNSFVESNIIGTYNLIQKCIGSNIRFHLVSTDEVYGDTINNIEPSKEEDQIISSSPYSASKAASEQLVMAWGRTYDLNHTHPPRSYEPSYSNPDLEDKFEFNNGIPAYDKGVRRILPGSNFIKNGSNSRILSINLFLFY